MVYDFELDGVFRVTFYEQTRLTVLLLHCKHLTMFASSYHTLYGTAIRDSFIKSACISSEFLSSTFGFRFIFSPTNRNIVT